MLASASPCFICGSNEIRPGTKGYLRCGGCGHEIRTSRDVKGELVNEALDATKIKKPDMKDRFQIGLAIRLGKPHVSLVDVGCGPGRFLYHAQRYFNRHLGIEVTTAAMNFGRRQLHVNINNELSAADLKDTSLLTMWHSLEHIDPNGITHLLTLYKDNLPKTSRLLISVPNRSSLHFALFGSRSVYYDYDHHLHQFSTKSLEMLLEKYGFKPEFAVTGVMYSFVGAALSFVNFFGPHNLLYMVLRRAERRPAQNIQLALYLAILAIFTPFAALIFAWEKLNPRSGGVLTMSFKRSE